MERVGAGGRGKKVAAETIAPCEEDIGWLQHVGDGGV